MAHCDESLDRIFAALKKYFAENDNHFPDTLERLVEKEYLTPWDLLCPASPFGLGDSSYFYRGQDLYPNISAQIIIAYDKLPVHKNRRNILFADGKQLRPPETVFESRILADNRIRQQLGLPELPAGKA